MAKVVSFRIKLTGSRDTIKQINSIGDAIQKALKDLDIKIKDDGLGKTREDTKGIGDETKKARSEMSRLLAEINKLQKAGKQNTDEYKQLTAQVAKLRFEQSQTNEEVKKQEVTLKAQSNLQKLINGEIRAGALSQKQFFQALNSGLDEADPKYQELLQDFVKLKQEQKEFNDNLRIQQRLLEQGSDVSGRFRRLNAELVNARAAYRSLTDEELRNERVSQRLVKQFGLQSDSVKELERRINELDRELKETDGRLGNFQRNVGNYTRAFRGAASALGQIGIGLGVSELASATTRLISESTELFDIQERADAQVRAALESTEGVAGRTLEQLKQFATERQALTLFGDEETQGIQSLLLTFTNIQEETFDRTTVAVQDYATALATATGQSVDTRSASIQLGKALNDPIKGLSALGRSGVQFSEQQRELIQNFTETGDIAAAQNIILEELETQFAGSAEAAAQAGTGAVKQIRNQIGDIKEEIGGELTPVLESFTRLQLSFFERLRGLIPFLVEYGAALLKLATVIGLVAARQAILNAQNNKGALAYRLIAKAGLDYDKVVALLTGKINVLTASTKRLSSGFRALTKVLRANPFIAILSLITGVVIGLNELAKSNETVRAAFQRVGDALTRLGAIFQPITDRISALFSRLVEGAENLGIFDALIDGLVFTVDLLAAGIDKLADFFGRVSQAARESYDNFGLVRIIVDAVRDRFNRFRAALQAIPSVFVGIAAAARQSLLNIRRRFERLAIQAEILQKRLQLAITFDDQAEADLRNQIASLREQSTELQGEGKSAGEAYIEAFNASVASRAEVSAELDAKRLETAGTEAGETAGKNLVDGFAKVTLAGLENELSKLQERLKKAEIGSAEFEAIKAQIKSVQSEIEKASGEFSKKLIEDRKKAIDSINELERGLIQNEFDASATDATTQAQSDISSLVGDPEQIRRQTTLIKSQLALSLSEIEQQRADSFADVIDRAKQAAANEIALLTGSPNEIEIQSTVIRSSLVSQIEQITTDRNEAISNSIAQAEASRDAEIAALVGSPEEIEANSATITATYERVISDLSAKRQSLAIKNELKINALRKQITSELGGELADELQTASLAELQIAKNTLDEKLAILETELEREREAIRQKALLRQQQLQIQLESGVSPEKAQAIADELAQIDAELKDKLLQSERDNAAKRLNLIQAIVPESVKAANDLAAKEIAINAEKNQKLLEDTKKRTEEEKKLNDDINQAIVDGAFEVAGSVVTSIVEREKQQIEEQSQIQQERLEATTNAQKESTRAFYEQQIAEAEGDTEKQAQLREELAVTLENIDRRRAEQAREIEKEAAKEQQKVAIKQAIINAALAATKTLAQLGLPAAIPALIGLAVTTATQIASIRGQRFEKGGALVQGLENYTVSAFELGGAIASAPDAQGASQGVPVEGVIQGRSHANGGIPLSFNGTDIEAEGGEYKLQNGSETYIINKRSTRIFRSQLDSLRGNTNTFDPAKRAAASKINAFGGLGVKFQNGGSLGVGLSRPLPAPVGLQRLSGSITREELLSSNTANLEAIQATSSANTNQIAQIAENMQAQVDAINARIDRIKVFTDPVEIVNAGNERKKAATALEL